MTERTARWAVVAALALFALVGAAASSLPAAGAFAVAAAVIVVGLGFRGTSGRVLFAGAVLAAAGLAVVCDGQPANVGWFGICVLAGWTALAAGQGFGLVFLSGAVVLFALEWLVISSDGGWAAWVAGTVFTTVVCLMSRRQRELIEQLRSAQAGLADRARLEERSRIARELHDVIAHSLTVSLLHVSSARLAVQEDPAEAIAALTEAERLGRQSLAEARQAVGMLRTDGAQAAAPLPGAADLTELVDGFRRAGADVRYRQSGPLDEIGATLGLSLYRILQEALTNAARHAPGAAVSVAVTLADSELALTVDSAGAGGGPAADGAGMAGMRARAESLGGSLTAGPAANGWQVAARIPLAAPTRSREPA